MEKKYLCMLFYLGLETRVETSFRCDEQELDETLINFEFYYYVTHRDVQEHLSDGYKSLFFVCCNLETAEIDSVRQIELQQLLEEMKEVEV